MTLLVRRVIYPAIQAPVPIVTPPVVPAMDGWFRPLSEPVPVASRPTEQEFAGPIAPVPNQSMAWLAPLALPSSLVRILYPALQAPIVPVAATVVFDWLQPLAEPVRRGLQTHGESAAPILPQPNVEQLWWLQAFSEPMRRRWQPPGDEIAPFVVASLVAPPFWLEPLNEPPRRPAGQFGETLIVVLTPPPPTPSGTQTQLFIIT